MYQIDNSTAATTQPASTAAGSAGFFTDGNPATGVAATILPAEWLNAVMMELANVVTGAGLTLAKNQFNQVLAAIKRLGQATIVLADTGAANAYTATNATPLVAGTWVDGVIQQVKIAHANTGASTYAPDGLPAIPIYGLSGQPLQGGELALNGTAILMRATVAGVNSGNPIAVLMECFGGAQPVAPAAASQHAVQLGQVGHGQCRLSVASATSLVLKPYNGNNVLVNGIPLTLPSAGVSVSNSGLSASTLYYVYLAGTTASPSLVLSATGHVTATSGVEVMSGDATKTLVGMIMTNASSQFSDTVLFRGCANWFNRRKLLGAALTSSVSTTSTSATKLSTTLDISFLCWSDDIPQQFICGNISNNTNSIITNVYGYIDGSQAGLAQSYAGTANFGVPYSLSNALALSEGMHTSSVYGSVSSASTGTFSANHSIITNA